MAVDFESAIVEVNSFGRYQLFYATLLGIPSIFAGAFIGCSHVFVSATPDHWCAVPELIEKGVPLHIRKNMSIPLIAQNDILQYSKCEMYKVNYTDITQIGENWPHNDSSWPTQKCQYGWEYDTTYYDVTLVTQVS